MASKFKVGDNVRITDSWVQNGAEFTITKISKGEGGSSYWASGDPKGYGVWERHLELVPLYSDFKPGDRVAVAFEGVITSTYDDTAYFGSGPKTIAAPISSLTKLTEPIPTTTGAVIRIDKTGTIYEHAGNGSWFIPGNEIEYRTEPQTEADDYGFTVLYAGDEKN